MLGASLKALFTSIYATCSDIFCRTLLRVHLGLKWYLVLLVRVVPETLKVDDDVFTLNITAHDVLHNHKSFDILRKPAIEPYVRSLFKAHTL